MHTFEVAAGESIEVVERKLIMATLQKNSNNKLRSARELGISLKTLYNRLNEYRTELTHGVTPIEEIE